MGMVKALLEWALTPWRMNGQGGWKQQPVLLVEGRPPFFADHPRAYINALADLHGDPTITRGPFFTVMGQLQDGLEMAWETEVFVGKKSSHRNGHR